MNLITTAALRGRRAVVFDWDGTLADTHDRNYQSLHHALQPHQISLTPEWYRQHCGLPIRDLLAQVPSPAPLPIDQIMAASRAHLLALTTQDTLAAIPHVVDLARWANAAGLPCAVASGAGDVLVKAGLDVLGLAELFHAVVTRDSVEHGKPAPDTFLEAARQLDIAPEDCLAVEDAPDGITAAQRAGMRVLVVHDGQLVWAATEGRPFGQGAVLT